MKKKVILKKEPITTVREAIVKLMINLSEELGEKINEDKAEDILLMISSDIIKNRIKKFKSFKIL